jgi:hypothetical protein
MKNAKKKVTKKQSTKKNVGSVSRKAKVLHDPTMAIHAMKKKVTKKQSTKKNVRSVSRKAKVLHDPTMDIHAVKEHSKKQYKAEQKVSSNIESSEKEEESPEEENITKYKTKQKVAIIQSAMRESVSNLKPKDSQLIAFISKGQQIVEGVQKHKKNFGTAHQKIQLLAKNVPNTDGISIVKDTFLNMLNYIHDEDTTDEKVRTVLRSHGLLLNKGSRNLKELCFYEPIEGGMPKKDLKKFLDEHAGHQLGIFSLERQTKMHCYYIVDLFNYIENKSGLNSTEIVAYTVSQWKKVHIIVPHRPNKHGEEDDVFSARELALIVQWYIAYMKFEKIVTNKKDVANILAHGDRIIPMYAEVDTRNFLRRFIGDTYDTIVQYASEKLQTTFSAMWRLISTKLTIDIFSTITCFIAQGFIYRNMMSSAQMGEVLIKVLDEYILGGIISGVISTYRGVTQGTGTYFSTGVSWLVQGLKFLGLDKFGDFLSTVLNAIELLVPNVLYGTVAGSVIILILSGPIGAMTALPTLVSTTVWAAGLELLAKKWELMARLLLPGTNTDAGLSYVIQMLQPTMLCSMLPFYKDRCQTVASKLVTLKGWYYIVTTIIDIFLDMGSVLGICQPSNRCRTLFATEQKPRIVDPTDTSFDPPPEIINGVMEAHYAPHHRREEKLMDDGTLVTLYTPHYNGTPFEIITKGKETKKLELENATR